MITRDISSMIFLAGYPLENNLSVQQLLDCTQMSDPFAQACFESIITSGGIDSESSYPYTGEAESCQFNPANIVAKLSSYQNVTANSESALVSRR